MLPIDITMKSVTTPIAQVGIVVRNLRASDHQKGAQRGPEGRDDGSHHISIHFCIAAATERVFGGRSTYGSVEHRCLAHPFTTPSNCLPLLMAWSSFHISADQRGNYPHSSTCTTARASCTADEPAAPRSLKHQKNIRARLSSNT